ncbi:pentatricopeptide repeat-containing protein At1g74600, chloroplastic [Quercus robur]|uniref:pentatricopeptide repeat-containing protein At1g74600, chloroplastic n=1 Tax=Quercus robur TaxID=38942 RepID=UPI002162DF5E|nr:pentatricopeptide repeat-containing protein At1g74600, chloroplastic [Quercus robur]
MNTLLNQNFHTKIPLLASKLISSLAVIEKSPTFLAKHEQNLTTPFDPFQFFNENRNSTQCTIRNTKVIHTHLLKSAALQSNIFAANSLLHWYCKSAAMVDALKLFDTLPQPNVFSWNIVILGYNQNDLFEDSWRIFCRMHSLGFELNEITCGIVLSACTALQAPMLGTHVYSLSMKNGFFSNGYIRAGMIDLFAKHCNFKDALRVFHDVSCENVVCWNAIISGAVRNGENSVALGLFRQMCCGPFQPNSFTFSSILTACAALEELDIGKGVQGWVIKCGAGDVFVGTAIVDLYAKCGDMEEAVKEFSRMPSRNVVSWTTVISGFVQKDDSTSALKFFKYMRELEVEINKYTVTSVLTACAKRAMIEEAIQIHSWILKTGYYLDAAVGAALINMYSKIGSLDLSELVFKEVGNIKNLGTCAAMISAFTQNQNFRGAIEMFQRMLQESVRPDKFCTSSLLSIIGCLYLGRQIHCYALKTSLVPDVSVGCSLFTMYSKCGSLEQSYKVFEQILEKDNVSWASMIAGFAEHGCSDQAIQLFREMLLEEIIPDQMTLTATLTACSALRSIRKGKELHGYALRFGVGKDIVVGGALVGMYSKCGSLELASRVFDMLPEKDQVVWSSLVSGYAQNGYIEKALMLFCDMLMADFTIDCFTVSSVLGAVALLNRSGIGTQLHAYITKLGLDSDVSVGSSLMTMYSKSGSLGDCRKAFDHIENPDLIGWTTMIVSYAQHGKGAEALSVYELMRKEGIKPDSVTFVGVLSACSHNGLVEEAYIHLNSMAKDYGIEPGYRHYACMVDLLGRSGRLKEAEQFINNMPVKPDALVWGTLLAACKVHGDIELGKIAAKKVMELEPCDAGVYVSLSNICADMGQWEDVLKIRSLMKGTGVTKEPGWSFV